MEKQEKRSRNIGALTSVGIHALLLLIFSIATGYRAPYPPAPEFGVIVNMGFDDQGSGDIQTDQPVADPNSEEQKPDEQPQPEEVKPTPVEESRPAEQKDDDEVLASKEESPVSVKKEEEKPKDKPTEVIKPKEETKKDEPKKEPEKLKTEFTKDDAQKSNTGNKGNSTQSEGDDVNKTGNKGQPNGTLDPNGQYTGTPGGGGNGNGIGLSMAGWAWADQPSTAGISNNESGRIVFEIECDEDGEIIGIKTLERGVTPATEQILRKEIMRTSLVRTAGTQAPPHSTGRVTFIIKSR